MNTYRIFTWARPILLLFNNQHFTEWQAVIEVPKGLAMSGYFSRSYFGWVCTVPWCKLLFFRNFLRTCDVLP